MTTILRYVSAGAGHWPLCCGIPESNQPAYISPSWWLQMSRPSPTIMMTHLLLQAIIFQNAHIAQHAYRVNTLTPRQNGRRFADDIFKCIFLNENARIALKISLKFVPKVRINNIPSLVQIMAWRRPGDRPLSEPMMVSLLMHICVTRPQWV